MGSTRGTWGEEGGEDAEEQLRIPTCVAFHLWAPGGAAQPAQSTSAPSKSQLISKPPPLPSTGCPTISSGRTLPWGSPPGKATLGTAPCGKVLL